MAQQELDDRASGLALKLSSIVSSLLEVEQEATLHAPRDPLFWTRVRESLDVQAVLSSIGREPAPGEITYTSVYHEWILGIVNERSSAASSQPEAQQTPEPTPLPSGGEFLSFVPPEHREVSYQPLVTPPDSDMYSNSGPAVSAYSGPPIAVPSVASSPPFTASTSPPFDLSTPSNPTQPFPERVTATTSLFHTRGPFLSPTTPPITYDNFSPPLKTYAEEPTIDPSLLSSAPPLPSFSNLPDFFAWGAPFPNGNLGAFPIAGPLTGSYPEASGGGGSSGTPGSNPGTPFSGPSNNNSPFSEPEEYFTVAGFAPTPTSRPPLALRRHVLSGVSIVRSDTISQSELHSPRPSASNQLPDFSGSDTGHGTSRSRSNSSSRGPDEGHSVRNGRHHQRSHSGSSTRRPEPYPTSPQLSPIDLPWNGSDSGSRPHSPGNGRRRGSSASREAREREEEALLGGRSRTGSTSRGHKRSISQTSQHRISGDFSASTTGGTNPADRSPATGLEQLSLGSMGTAHTWVGGPQGPDIPLFPPSGPSRAARETWETSLRALPHPGGGGGTVREKRKLKIDNKAVYHSNPTHVFVAHVPERDDKVIITQRDVRELVLDPTNDPLSILWQLTYENLPYSLQLIEGDYARNQSYVFQERISTDRKGKKLPRRYHVQFRPERNITVSIIEADGCSLTVPRLPITFVHFAPGTFISFPCQPIGSPNWWRLPICVGKHLKPDLADGSWTGRYDDDEPRRPSRLVEHYAECPLRNSSKSHVDSDPLGKLARAVRAPLKGKEKKSRRPSATRAEPRAARDESVSVGGEEEDDDDDDEEPPSMRMTGIY